MRIEELERELRATRPEPHMDFARRLDEWAEAGFPRDRGLGPGLAARAGTLRRLWDRVVSTPPRRLVLPAAATATAVVVAGVVIGTAGQISGGSEETALTVPSAAKSANTAQQLNAGGGGGGAASSAESAAPAQGSATQEYNLALPDDARAIEKPVTPSAADSATSGVARGQDERIVDATARLTLGAEADEVQNVANGVVDVTDQYGGVVQTSQVTSDQGGARASFELELPYKRLDAALADLSALADVVSRTEGGEDITARAVRARKELAQTLEQLHDARIALIKADTREQKLVLQSRIDSLQATAGAQRTALNGVKRQGRFATVNVDVTSTSPAAGEDGNWGLGDAVDDAGRVLEVIGGVALISLAILLPLALVVSLVAVILIRARGRARDKALDG